MTFSIITLFPHLFTDILNTSILKIAQDKKLVKFDIKDLRSFGKGPRRQVDDAPYGGGVGMILKVDVVERAVREEKSKYKKSLTRKRVILLDPKGTVFTQKKAELLASNYDHLILVCGHYEGADERINEYIDESISIGDYILTGGEIPCLVIIDAVTRVLPGVLKDSATKDESFSLQEGRRLLSYPQYTRPPSYKGSKVPQVLLSGHHEKIRQWKKSQSIKVTKRFRPDLLRHPQH